jgi:DNA-directed RNA polymerase subunit RPC12/RpoP
MSREEYTPPTLTNAGTSGGTGTGAVGGFNITGQGSTFEDISKPVAYLCGDCDTKVTLKKGDPIRCKECGYRVLYKEKTNR